MPVKSVILNGLLLGLVGSLLGLVFSVRAAAVYADEVSAAPSPLGHVPVKAVERAEWVGRQASDQFVAIALVLPIRHSPELHRLLRRLYDPSDPLYGRYLRPSEFTRRFAPTEADYETAARWLEASGFAITQRHSNRLLLHAQAPASVVESAFKVQLHRFRNRNGREFFAPDQEPQLAGFGSAGVLAVVGLDNAALGRSHLREHGLVEKAIASPDLVGTGPFGGLTPEDVRRIYGLPALGLNGAGQTLAVFEIDGYNRADIAAYRQQFGLRAVPLKNVRVGGASGLPGLGSDETTLDIEMQMALAPGARRIIVYMGPNDAQGALHTYNRIANDNLAKQISTSWGSSEDANTPAFLAAENQIFQQMAAQGQSIYAASGDSGAYDDGASLSVDDPASQPYVVGVGATSLSVLSGENYGFETTWNSGSIGGGASGGGVSQFWRIPSYQRGIDSLSSISRRNVPDISLNGDPNTGYAVFYNGNWRVFGGTSMGAPLWAAFTAMVNQQRRAYRQGLLGFGNQALYAAAESSRYPDDFHDIRDGSTNLFYHAVSGYDNATGWGSFVGVNLLADLAPLPPPPAAPSILAVAARRNAVSLKWSAPRGAKTYNIYRGLASGAEQRINGRPVAVSHMTNKRLTSGITYYFRVTAVGFGGESAASNEVSVAPL